MPARIFSRYRRILQESSWVAGSLGITAIINLIGTRIITHYLPPALYGQINLLQNLLVLLRNLFCFPLLNSAWRFYSDAAQEGDVGGLRRMLTRWLRRVMLPMQGILLAIGGYLCWRGKLSVWSILALALFLLLDVCRTFEVALFNGARRQRPAAIIAVSESLLRPVLIVGVVVFFSARLDLVLLATAGSLLIPLVILYASTKLEGVQSRPSGRDPPYAEALRRFARDLIPYAFLMWITSVSDRYIIEWFSADTASVGIYAAGYGLISQPFIMVNSVVSLTLRPVYFAQVSNDEKALARRTFLVWLAISVCLCITGFGLAVLLRHWVVGVFLAPKYAQAAVVVPWVAFGYLFYVIQQVLEQHLLAHKRARTILLVQGLGALCSLLATIPLVAKFGMVGAAYACPIYFAAPCVLTAILIYANSAPQPASPGATISS
jgi:O-antigen/teichoic acid export membrane protein